ncbi:MAG: hypothetical protein A2Z75_08700 [Chloroflexi bacterium RBG_13_50_10]|nr:MAG: hypothetical protein A2Z75_08700 [Chloroflexi bacterium RBG_13_50_10]
MAKTIKIISLAAVLLLVVLAVSFSPANIARATTCQPDVWVAPPPFGNDGNPGTQAQPFATIQKGVDIACDDGTVHVAAGTYHENLHIDAAQDLMGAGAPDTILDGGDCGPAMVISSAPNEVNIISGFTIQNGSLLASIWNPAKEQVLYAGIKLPSLQMLPRLFGFITCGGGIYIAETHIVTLNDCVIKDNEAEEGGGICNFGQLYMNRCTVSGNDATTHGGGIYNEPGVLPDSGKMWLTNCTISGNRIISSATGTNGAGISNGQADMTLTNCTIANNTTTDPDCRGGGFYNDGTATFKNTIVANNTAGTGNNGYNNLGTTTSQGYNLDSENSCGFNQPGDLVNTNPLLGPLQDNGGPTFTQALLNNSPAIDAGANAGAPATDQRGVTRPQGQYVDIGAYEETEGAGIVSTSQAGGPHSSPSVPPPQHTLNPPQMSLQYLSVNPQQTTANQPVTISTNVINTGDEGGNFNVALKINGLVEQTKMVSVGPQGTQPVKFTVAKAKPGTYNITILDKSGSFTILGAGGTAGAPVNGGLIAFLIMGVLVLASVMVLLLTRRPA